MSTDAPPARIHLIPALRVHRVVVIRRKPTKTFHIMLWNTETGEIEHGSWFHGRIHEDRCDVSPDGTLMVYLAMGDTGRTWNGVCEPPRLKTLAEWDNLGTWGGGGWWTSDGCLIANSAAPPGFGCSSPEIRYLGAAARARLTVQTGSDPACSDMGPPLVQRLMRDGWRRAGDFPKFKVVGPRNKLQLEDDPGWYSSSPVVDMTLRMFVRTRDDELLNEFRIDERPGLLDERVTWATWDVLGQLLVARAGKLERYAPGAIGAGAPSAVIDLEQLVAPWQRGSAPPSSG